MPLRVTAYPAVFGKSGTGFESYEVDLFDEKRIIHRAPAATMKEAVEAFDSFCATLPPTGWSIVANWEGRDKAPRGFKAASERNEFVRQIKPAQQEAA